MEEQQKEYNKNWATAEDLIGIWVQTKMPAIDILKNIKGTPVKISPDGDTFKFVIQTPK